MTAKKTRRSRKQTNEASTAPARGANALPQEALPRRTLEQAVRIPQVLHSTYAGQGAALADIATTLGIGAQSPNTRYLAYAALAYGLVTRDGDSFSLSETGRKIVAPTYENEDREGRIKALLTPSVLSKFYTDYNGHSIPAPAHFPNVLETRFGVPRDRVQEAIDLIVENARYAAILREGAGGEQPRIDLSAAGISTAVRAAPAELPSGPPDDGASDSGTDWSKVCFYITPIGEESSEERKHTDMLLKHLLQPVAEEFGLTVVRADKIERSGLISQQVFEHVVRARLCVADLSFSNPNAFYELGVRHVSLRPTIQLIRKGDKIPFDVSQGRTITIDTSDVYTVMDRIESAKRELREHMHHLSRASGDAPSEDNPVAAYLPGLKVTIPK
jgi:hypothetical protein